MPFAAFSWLIITIKIYDYQHYFWSIWNYFWFFSLLSYGFTQKPQQDSMNVEHLQWLLCASHLDSLAVTWSIPVAECDLNLLAWGRRPGEVKPNALNTSSLVYISAHEHGYSDQYFSECVRVYDIQVVPVDVNCYLLIMDGHM